jgi:hypothetical protein
VKIKVRAAVGVWRSELESSRAYTIWSSCATLTERFEPAPLSRQETHTIASTPRVTAGIPAPSVLASRCCSTPDARMLELLFEQPSNVGLAKYGTCAPLVPLSSALPAVCTMMPVDSHGRFDRRQSATRPSRTQQSAQSTTGRCTSRRITTSSAGHGGPSRRALRSSRAARCPFGNWSPRSQRHAATIARTRTRHSRTSS